MAVLAPFAFVEGTATKGRQQIQCHRLGERSYVDRAGELQVRATFIGNYGCPQPGV
jgi:hypothetical protein